MRRFIFLSLLILTSCAGVTQPEKLSLSPVPFEDLPGWQNDRQGEAIPAFARSCDVIMKKLDNTALGVGGTADQWRAACDALAHTSASDDVAARAYFENYFTPYAVDNDDKPALFTGYYEAELHGSLHKTKRFHVPLYEKPRDLVTVDLGLFKSELKGQHITGKVTKSRLVPYDDRAAIEKNKLKGRARILLWVADPVDAFFLAIQGSGRVRLPNGNFIRVGYDGANGRAYVALGKVLADMNEIEKPITMQKIRAWLAEHPDQAQEVMNKNPSYVFFRRIKGDGPIGAEGVALTPRRSLAIDPSYTPLGMPLWLECKDGHGDPIERLMIAQDTGGAIKGPVRGDFFWGAGPEAEEQAGAMQSPGHYYLLLPKEVNIDEK